MDSHGPWNVKEKGHDSNQKLAREKKRQERELRTQSYIDGSEKGGHILKNVKVRMTPLPPVNRELGNGTGDL